MALSGQHAASTGHQFSQIIDVSSQKPRITSFITLRDIFALDKLRNVARALPASRFSQRLSWGFTLVNAFYVLWSININKNVEWHAVYQWFKEKTVLKGLAITLSLTVVAMIIGVILGLLVQLIFWYNLSTRFPRVSLGIPFGPEWISWNTNDQITPLTVAIAGLALNEAAYMAKIIRGGLLSIDNGQVETAQAFGMSRSRALRRIIIPQAMRAIRCYA